MAIQQKQNHRQVETPKTAASERKVDMSPELATELKRVLVEKKKQASAAGKPFDMEHWIFPNEEVTTIHYCNFRRRIWLRIQDEVQVRRRTTL